MCNRGAVDITNATGPPATARRPVLEMVDLDGFADRVPAAISIGEQQRNAAGADGVFSTIRRAAGDGTSCLIATHNEELLEYADRVVAIRDGRVEAVQRVEATP
jgi:ABC-type ATPase involved in cell division